MTASGREPGRSCWKRWGARCTRDRESSRLQTCAWGGMGGKREGGKQGGGGRGTDGLTPLSPVPAPMCPLPCALSHVSSPMCPLLSDLYPVPSPGCPLPSALPARLIPV
eukprot:216227-Chlamydomonas_euryale.AAC.1